MRTLIDPLYKRLGYQMLPNDKHLDIYLRTLAVAWACGLDHPECKQETRRQYAEWMDKIEPDEPSENPYVLSFITLFIISFLYDVLFWFNPFTSIGISYFVELM